MLSSFQVFKYLLDLRQWHSPADLLLPFLHEKLKYSQFLFLLPSFKSFTPDYQIFLMTWRGKRKCSRCFICSIKRKKDISIQSRQGTTVEGGGMGNRSPTIKRGRGRVILFIVWARWDHDSRLISNTWPWVRESSSSSSHSKSTLARIPTTLKVSSAKTTMELRIGVEIHIEGRDFYIGLLMCADVRKR